MKGYIHIDNSCFTEMHLTPTEAVLYSLVKGYCSHGQKFERKVEDIAKQVNMSDCGIRRAFNRLVKGGYLKKERKQLGVEYKLSDEWKERVVQSTEQVRYKVPRRTVQSTEQERYKVPNTPFNNKLDNNNSLNKENFGEFEGLVLEIFTEHYRNTHSHEYAPNYATLTTATRNVCDNIRRCMEGDKYVCDIETFRAYFAQWLALAWQKTDEWHRQRWSMEFVNSQFNYFNTQVNNGDTSTTNREQRGGGVSDEYIAKQLDKIARSRARRAAESGTPAEGR